jgi:hypothetical protein
MPEPTGAPRGPQGGEGSVRSQGTHEATAKRCSLPWMCRSEPACKTWMMEGLRVDKLALLGPDADDGVQYQFIRDNNALHESQAWWAK